jgi:hypothetical protein
MPALLNAAAQSYRCGEAARISLIQRTNRNTLRCDDGSSTTIAVCLSMFGPTTSFGPKVAKLLSRTLAAPKPESFRDKRMRPSGSGDDFAGFGIGGCGFLIGGLGRAPRTSPLIA